MLSILQTNFLDQKVTSIFPYKNLYSHSDNE